MKNDNKIIPIKTLERRDKYFPNTKFTRIYNTNILYTMKDKYRINILRIVKKTLLGTNFGFWYSRRDAIISAILNFLLVNILFIFFPKILSNAPIIKSPKTISVESENNSTIISTDSDINKKTILIFKIIISNILDLGCLSYLFISYKIKQNKITKYMNKYTQCSLISENSLIKKHYSCLLSKNGNFNIEIYLTKKNKYKKEIQNKKYFFEYVINLPNIRSVINYTYKKMYLSKEIEIIKKIMIISNEIEYRYKKKLLHFLLLIFVILVILPLLGILNGKRYYNALNYIGFILLILYVDNDIYCQNKKEQFQRINELNEEYFNDGYYIYSNDYIISIFYLKEEYKITKTLDNIRLINEELLNEFNLI